MPVTLSIEEQLPPFARTFKLGDTEDLLWASKIVKLLEHGRGEVVIEQDILKELAIKVPGEIAAPIRLYRSLTNMVRATEDAPPSTLLATSSISSIPSPKAFLW